MIVWVSKHATKRPNDQRAHVVRATPDQVILEMCGDEALIAVKPEAIVGVELSEQVCIRFKATSINTHQTTGLSPYPASPH